MDLNILADILIAEDVAEEGGVWLNSMPSDVDVGIMIRMPLEGVTRDPALPNYYKTDSLQVIVRDVRHAPGEARAKLVSKALTIRDRVFNNQDGSFRAQIKQLYPRMLPISYPLSEGDQIEWSINFSAAYVWPDA